MRGNRQGSSNAAVTSASARRCVLRASAAAAVALSGLALLVSGAASASVQPRRVGQAPRIAQSAVRLGSLQASTRLEVDVQLRPRDPSALARYAAAVSTPASPLYGRYLSRGEFASRFGPTPATMGAVTRWLASRGLTIGTVSANHLTIHAAASASTLERAFSIRLERLRLPGGRVAFANAQAPMFASSVARVVQGVVGLDDLAAPQWLGVEHTPRAAALAATSPSSHRVARVATVGPQACSTAVSDAHYYHAYTAGQFAAAYNFASLYAAGDEGAGITIAVFEQEDNLASDIAAYQSCYGTSASLSYIEVDGGAGAATPNGEAAEDIEVALGLAPKAHIDVYQAPTSLKAELDNYTAMVDRDTAQVISTSWGQCEAQSGSTLLAGENAVFEQAAVQGQSIFAASGDSGSSGCSTKALQDDDPASQPYVTGVGGTRLNAIGPPPSEVVWNASAESTGAGGGGVSSAHLMPSYQSTSKASLHVISKYSSGAPCGAAKGSYCREVPDVSADSDYGTGYLTYYDGQWGNNGGTSASAPLWAALTALADASRTCAGKSIGFANPALYAAAATSYAADFHDVTSGTNDDTNYGNTSGLYPAGVGYDMATGLGTPNGGSLTKTLCNDVHLAVEPTTTAISASKRTLTYGSERAEVFSVHVTGRSGDGHPVGTIVVFNGGAKLCSHSLRVLTGDRSGASCSPGGTAMAAGRHSDVYAVFDPAVGSSSVIHYRYRSSRSRAVPALTVKRDGTATTASLAPTNVVQGNESAALLHVSVRSHFGESVSDGDRVRVTVGSATCVATLSGGNGTCSIANSALPAGSYEPTATFEGDASLAPSTGAAAEDLKVT